MIQKTRILIIGATGYIGGSILSELLKAQENTYILSALARKPEHVEKLEEAEVRGILFKDLDDFETIKNTAKQYDIIIAAASARHEGCATACIEGLSERKGSPLGGVHYIHTSGASMVGDWTESGDLTVEKTYSDVDDDIFEIEKEWPEAHSPVRKVNQLVIALGEANGVNTYIVTPPLIFGRGTGLFSPGYGQLHMLVELSIQRKQAVVIGSGAGVWSRVKIDDLNQLFLLIAQRILSREKLPSGRAGYYFVENGSQSWKSIACGVGQAGKELGIFETPEVESVSLQKAAEAFFDGHLRNAEGVLASNSRIKADKARQVLGWKPKFGEDAFKDEIKEVVTLLSKESNHQHRFR